MSIVRDKDLTLHLLNEGVDLPDLLPISGETFQIINGILPDSSIPRECFHLELKYLMARGFKSDLFQHWNCPVFVSNDKEVRNLVATYFVLYGFDDYEFFSTMAIGVKKEDFHFLMECFEDKLEDFESYKKRKLQEEIEHITLGMKNIGRFSKHETTEIIISDINHHYHSFNTIFLNTPNIQTPIKTYYETIPTIIFIHLIKGVYRGTGYYLIKYGIKEERFKELAEDVISIIKEFKAFEFHQVQQFLTKWSLQSSS